MWNRARCWISAESPRPAGLPPTTSQPLASNPLHKPANPVHSLHHPTCAKLWIASVSNAQKENALPANRLPLLPQYQQWVNQWVMTEPEARQMQFLMDSLLAGQEVEAPQELEEALQRLALHSLVDEETATRH